MLSRTGPGEGGSRCFQTPKFFSRTNIKMGTATEEEERAAFLTLIAHLQSGGQGGGRDILPKTRSMPLPTEVQKHQGVSSQTQTSSPSWITWTPTEVLPRPSSALLCPSSRQVSHLLLTSGGEGPPGRGSGFRCSLLFSILSSRPRQLFGVCRLSVPLLKSSPTSHHPIPLRMSRKISCLLEKKHLSGMSVLLVGRVNVGDSCTQPVWNN